MRPRCRRDSLGGVGLLLLHPLVSVLGADAAVPATGAFDAVMLAFVLSTSASPSTSSFGCSGTASTGLLPSSFQATAGAAGDRDVGDAGRPVHPDRDSRQSLVRAGPHHLGVDRHRGHLFLVGVVLWLAYRRPIDRGLAEGSPERAEDVLEQAEA
jgi:hypothetical protein